MNIPFITTMKSTDNQSKGNKQKYSLLNKSFRIYPTSSIDCIGSYNENRDIALLQFPNYKTIQIDKEDNVTVSIESIDESNELSKELTREIPREIILPKDKIHEEFYAKINIANYEAINISEARKNAILRSNQSFHL